MVHPLWVKENLTNLLASFEAFHRKCRLCRPIATSLHVTSSPASSETLDEMSESLDTEKSKQMYLGNSGLNWPSFSDKTVSF